MSQIAAASSEQESGIGEINSAIANMDNVTQQNAALVEEAAATAESVHTEATNLLQLVGFFTIDDGPSNEVGRSVSNDRSASTAADRHTKLKLAVLLPGARA